MLFKETLHSQRLDMRVLRIVKIISNGPLIFDYIVLVEPEVVWLAHASLSGIVECTYIASQAKILDGFSLNRLCMIVYNSSSGPWRFKVGSKP